MNKGDLSKEIEYDKIEVVNSWNIQVKQTTKVMEVQDVSDDRGNTSLGKVQIGSSVHRHVLVPFSSSKSGDKWTHTATDISGEDASVQSIANVAWTDSVKANYKTWAESQS